MEGSSSSARVSILVLTAISLFGVLLSGPAWAQCTKDTDCKGNRVCRMGVCEDPLPAQPAPYGTVYAPAAPAATPAPAPAPPPYYAPAPPPPAPSAIPQPAYAAPVAAPPPVVQSDPGWAAGAATYGIVSGVVALGLAIASEATKEDTLPSAPLGGVATALFGISLPIVAIGGSSARGNPAVTGSLGLRIAGWIGYGVTLADAAFLLSQVGQRTLDDGLILSVGLLGAASMACFVVDARMSAAEATRLQILETGGRAQLGPRGGVLAPLVLRDPANPHRLATGLAWLGRF
jgi:hypothetical protein